MHATSRRKSAAALAIALVTGCLVASTSVGVAGAATTEVTKDESPDLAIAQTAVAESTLTVGPGAGLVTTVTVTIGATHTRVGDLVARLTHVASGTTVTLLDRPGPGIGDNSNLLQAHPISFQDGAGLPDPETMGSGPGMGSNAVVCRDDGVCTYRPHESFAGFTGLPGSGEWQLSIADMRAQDSGLLDAWTLRLDTEPEVTMTVPDAPADVIAVAGDGEATVSWTAPGSDGGSAITAYVVTPFVGSDPLASVVFASPATTQMLSGLTNGTPHHFEVAAINAVGTGPASAVSDAVIPMASTVPGVPTIGSVAAGDGQVTVSWTAPTSDGGSPILGYVVTPYIGFLPQGSRYFVSAVTTGTVTGLTNGTTYRFKVRAWNAVGVSDFSGTSSAATPMASTAPGTPTIGVATAGDGQATVSWSAPMTDGGTPIIGYIVTPYIGFDPQVSVYFVGTATTQTVSGLANGTTYRFRVRAWNAVGVSGFSTASNAVTPAP